MSLSMCLYLSRSLSLSNPGAAAVLGLLSRTGEILIQGIRDYLSLLSHLVMYIISLLFSIFLYIHFQLFMSLILLSTYLSLYFSLI